jgi:hypothetical protein
MHKIFAVHIPQDCMIELQLFNAITLDCFVLLKPLVRIRTAENFCARNDTTLSSWRFSFLLLLITYIIQTVWL